MFARRLRLFSLLILTVFVAACSGGGGGYGGSGGSKATTVKGGGIKGPMAGAVVSIYAVDFNGSTVSQGALVATGETDAQAKITGLSLPFPQVFPYLLAFDADADTTDLTTGQAPVITSLKTVLTSTLAAKGEQIYATPLTNMAVDIAFQNFDDFDGTTASNEEDLQAALNAAAGQVASTVGFGLDANKIDIFDTPPLVDETVSVGGADSSKTPSADVVAYRAAVEALTAVVSQINDASSDANSSPESVLANLAKDLAGDGELDGDDGQGNVVVEAEGLEVLDQDPDSLVIPNTGGKTVADIEAIVADETATTGNEVSPAQQQSIKDQQTTTQPAARNPDRDGDGVLNAKDDYPDDITADRDTDGDGDADVRYENNAGARGAVVANCGSNVPKLAVEAGPAACSDADDDNDGVSDADESTNGTNPLLADTDGDGVNDGDESALGTDPLKADTDGDDVADAIDNCPLVSNPNQTDADEDGLGAACDDDEQVKVADADKDGVLDAADNCPAVYNPKQANFDGDTQGDLCDDNDDNDAAPDASDAFPLNASETADNDKDGIGDNADTDDDNDGLSDVAETSAADATDPKKRDTDGDNVMDASDKFPNDPSESRDNDGDKIGDNADTDDDNDNVSDSDEAIKGTNPRVADTDGDNTPGQTDNNDDTDNCPLIANNDQADNDQDGKGDVCDDNDDGDTILDTSDNCPLIDNEDQTNTDGLADGGDACDTDDDEDTILDGADNCPVTSNQDQANFDGDAQGDACDTDDDNDQVLDTADSCPTTPENLRSQVAANGCAPGEVDTDGDGVFDNADSCPATPTGEAVNGVGCSTSQTDADNDGVFDNADQCANTPSGESVGSNGCSDSQVDTDNDGVFDNADQCTNTPAGETVDGNGCSASQTDADNDGVFDSADQCANTPSGESVGSNGCSDSQVDTDNDGVFDNADQCANTPAGESVDGNGCSASQTDADNDGVFDSADQCANTPTGESVDAVGCSDSQLDSDSDGVFDNADQCINTPTGETVDANGCSASQTDTDNDGVFDDADQCANTPSGETVDSSGCSASQTDADNDGVFDDADTCGNTPTGAAVDQNGCAASQRDTDGDSVTDDVDECPGTPTGETADETGCSPSQEVTLNFDGNYRSLELGFGQRGPAEGAGEFDRNANSEVIISRMELTIATATDESISISGDDANESGDGVFVGRYGDGANAIGNNKGHFDLDDEDCPALGDCPFSETLTKHGSLLVLNGFVDGEIDEDNHNNETFYSYDHEQSQRLVFTPVVADDAVQALLHAEFSIDQDFDAEDVDGLVGNNDPDNIDDDTKLGSDLEPLAGAAEERGVFGSLYVAIPVPDAQLGQATIDGEYGLVSLISSTFRNSETDPYDLGVEQIRGDLTVTNGVISSTRYRGIQLDSLGSNGSLSYVDQAASGAATGAMTPGTGNGELAFAWNDEGADAALISPDGKMAVFNRYGPFEDGSGEDVEFGVLLKKGALATGSVPGDYRLNMVAREFSSEYGAMVMQGVGLKLVIGDASASCRTAFGASNDVSCFSATLSGEDGHSFFEGRQLCDDNTGAQRCFGPLHADGTATDGDYFEGQEFSDPVLIIVDNNSNGFVMDFLETNDSDQFVDENDVVTNEAGAAIDDSYRGYIGVNGALAFTGGTGSEEDGYGNLWLGVGAKVEGAAENAAFDNVAPVIESITAKAAGVDVTEQAPATPGAGVVLASTVSNGEAGDQLTYEWVSYAGTLSATDTASVTWTAPNTASGSTKIELRVSDGLSRKVKFVDVYWGVAAPTANEKAAALVVMDEALESPEDTIDWLLFVVPDSSDLPTCENTAGTVTRTFTDNNAVNDSFDPGVGDVVSVTFDNCVEDFNSFDNSFYGVNDGEFRMTVTKANDTEYDWDVDVIDLEFVDGSCTNSADTCEAEEKEIDNGSYTVEQSVLETGFDTTAPSGTNFQIDTFISFSSYSTLEQELNDNDEFENTATFGFKSAANAFVFITEYTDSNDDTLAYRLDVDFGYTGTETGAGSPAIDIDVDTGVGGLVQGFSDASGFEHMVGDLAITVNALTTVDIAEGWVVNVSAEIGSDTNDDSTQAYEVVVDTDDDGNDDFGFEATQSDVWDSDECDITPPSAAADCGI